MLGDRAIIHSAGSVPSGSVQPWAIEVLHEIGIDISSNTSKSWNDLPPAYLENLDYVITLCAQEVCPALPTQAKRLHWPVNDPASASDEQKPHAFRMARDEIHEKLEFFISTIGHGP